MRVILDTNILLACIPRKSPYRLIFDSLLAGQVDLVITNEIVSEYAEIIAAKTNNMVAANISELLLTLPNVYRIEVFYHWNLITQDPSDNKFVDAALSGGCDYLITNDHHFDRLSNIEFPRVEVRSLSAFMNILQNIVI